MGWTRFRVPNKCVGLNKRVGRELSKKLFVGQKRKLLVGIALIGDPKIIFLGKYFMHIKYGLIGY